MHLSEKEIRPLLALDEVRRAVEDALKLFSAGKAMQPLRTMVSVAEHGGFLGLMPGYAGALGLKIVTFYPGNTDQPTPYASILLFDPKTGELRTTMDAHLITAVRTAAVSAAAANLLARKDAATLAIIGAGGLATTHLPALRGVRELTDVRVWSPHRAPAFAKTHGITLARSAREAVEGADIVLTATDSRTPVISGAWLAAGALVCAVGAPRPDWRELDDETVARAQGRVYVDSREAALKESGDVRAAGSVYAELGEVLNGTRAARQSEGEIVVFKSLGMAVQDLAAADLVWRKFTERGDRPGRSSP